ncbi:adenylate kinase 7 [Trichomycterus rosablanca]|uniref:adenylate kinase 7 n=1 Tax=Trichomycterus rosablanca TaxID=2290929 RepID=UPI002F358578
MAATHQSKRVFINNVDTYGSKYIAKFLSSCVVGASLVSEVDHTADDEEEPSHDEVLQKSSKEGTFQMVGTISGKTEGKNFSFMEAEYTNLPRDELFHYLMELDVIIYHINQNPDQTEEASWAVSALHKKMDMFPAPKMFILISSVMTWALTKPVDPDDPEMPFTEEDYRRRKPHPNFKDHIVLEKLVVKLGKTNPAQFSTYVIASGLQYGMGEQAFHYFFKKAWLGELLKVPIFGEGSNIVPAIHINDLARIVQNVIDHKPKPRYFLAVDDSRNTTADIVKAIASTLGSGKTQTVPKEDVYLTKELTQEEIDGLFVDLRMEAVYLKENFSFHWVSEMGIVENIEQVAEEYKLTRDLLPLRLCLLGPPAVGKSTIAEKICRHYKLHHVRLKETIVETLGNLESGVQKEEVENEEDEESDGAQEFLETLKENMEQNGGRLDDQYIIQIIKDKLNSKPCRNQGFVLDGFPKTYDQAKELFSADDEESQDVQTKIPPHNKKLIPEFVFSLEATDALLKNRVINLPENVVSGTSYEQDKFLQRLAKFRENNMEDETVLNYFDELDVNPERIEIMSSDDVEYTLLMEKVVNTVGKVRNYGPSIEEVEQEERRQAEIRVKEESERRAEIQRKEKEEKEQRAQRWEEWTHRLTEEMQREEELLEAQSVPLRHYLMTDVMPTLTQGLIECCRLRPEDPVDFLAEYLIQNNPQAE